jgi:hypothetical protein
MFLIVCCFGTASAQYTPAQIDSMFPPRKPNPHKGPPSDLPTAKILFLLQDSITLAQIPERMRKKSNPNSWNLFVKGCNEQIVLQAPKYPFPYMVDHEKNIAWAQSQGCKYVFRFAPANALYPFQFVHVSAGESSPELPLLVVNIATGEEWRVGELPQFYAHSGGPTLKYFTKKVCKHFDIERPD